MGSFSAKVKMFHFCPKTMDYGVLTEIEVILCGPFILDLSLVVRSFLAAKYTISVHNNLHVLQEDNTCTYSSSTLTKALLYRSSTAHSLSKRLEGRRQKVHDSLRSNGRCNVKGGQFPEEHTIRVYRHHTSG